MKKTNKKKLEEFIRVDHAGERGAIKIYEGQLLALNTIVKNDDLKQTIGEMKKHEQEHSNFFEDEIEKRNIKPTKLLESLNKNMPVDCKDATFKILGVSLAAINTILSILIVIISIRTLVYEANK